MGAAKSKENLNYVPVTGPGVDALERRKEHNNDVQVNAQLLGASIAKVKNEIFEGIRALTAEAYKLARRV
jgi:hypothetical protein